MSADAAELYATSWPEQVGRELARLRFERDEARRECERLRNELRRATA